MPTITGIRLRAIRVSSVAKSSGFGPSATTMKGAALPGAYWLGTNTETVRVQGAGRLVVTTSFAGSAGSGVPKVPGSRAMPVG